MLCKFGENEQERHEEYLCGEALAPSPFGSFAAFLYPHMEALEVRQYDSETRTLKLEVDELQEIRIDACAGTHECNLRGNAEPRGYHKGKEEAQQGIGAYERKIPCKRPPHDHIGPHSVERILPHRMQMVAVIPVREGVYCEVAYKAGREGKVRLFRKQARRGGTDYGMGREGHRCSGCMLPYTAMAQLPLSIVLTIVILTVFLMFVTGLKYASLPRFLHTRLMMTAFFLFIVATITVSFWEYALMTLPYSAPAFVAGIIAGAVLGVRAAQERLEKEGAAYLEHFANIHPHELRKLTWWTLVNFYTVMSALLLINFIGLSTVIFHEARNWVLLTSAVGAFLLGTIVPYLIHVWTIKVAQPRSSTHSE